VRKIGLE